MNMNNALQQDSEFISDINAVTLFGISYTGHIILWSATLFIIIAIIWAANANIEEVATGQGSVIPSSRIQVLQNLEGGILTEIMVQEGEIVERNQPVMQLDDTRFSSSYKETHLKYLSLLATTSRLRAEIEDIKFIIPVEVRTAAPKLGQDEYRLYLSRISKLQSSVLVLQQQEKQRRQQLAETNAKKDQLQRSFNLVKKEIDMSAPLVKDGALSEVELLRLQRTANDLKGEYDITRLSLPRIRSSLTEVSRKIDEVKINFRNDSILELNEAQAELSRTVEMKSALQDRVTRTLVRSPVRGTVKQIMINTVGGVVQPGMDLIEIVPMEDTLLVEAKIRPSDIAFLRPGQDATVKLTAYDFSIYGGLPAKLEHISADTIVNDKDEHFYLIKVRTDRSYFGNRKEELNIISGMTASVDILTGEKTVLDYLLKPILKAKQNALRER